MASFVAILDDFNTQLWRHHIRVEAEIAEQFIEGDNRRVICTLFEEHRIHAALMPDKGEYFILINKEIKDKFGLGTGDEIPVKLEKDRSEYGMPMPDEFSVLLEQDPEAKAYFEALTMGKRRSLIYLVSKVKNTNSRLNKALAITTHLKQAQGKLDFKALNVLIKEFNQRGRTK